MFVVVKELYSQVSCILHNARLTINDSAYICTLKTIRINIKLNKDL
jgi:hypothetical protein